MAIGAHGFAALLLLAAIASSNPASAQGVDRDKELRGLAAAEREFAAFTVKEGFREGFIKYFADDGIGFGPHPERTREKLMKTPPETGTRKVIFNWAPMFGDISEAGDLGYTTGPVLYTDAGENPRPPRHGMYFSVWQKHADGSWKVAIDMGVPVPEAAAPIGTKFTAAERVIRTNITDPTVDDYRQLDRAFWGSIAKTSPAKAYASRLDKQFRIHRARMMPATDMKALPSGMIAQTKFEIIDGKIAKSNDLAFTYGKYTTVNEPTGEETGYYVHVWRRNANGKWKLVADVTNPLPKK
jgi:ketosteroid isomerase-like protein